MRRLNKTNLFFRVVLELVNAGNVVCKTLRHCATNVADTLFTIHGASKYRELAE